MENIRKSLLAVTLVAALISSVSFVTYGIFSSKSESNKNEMKAGTIEVLLTGENVDSENKIKLYKMEPGIEYVKKLEVTNKGTLPLIAKLNVCKGKGNLYDKFQCSIMVEEEVDADKSHDIKTREIYKGALNEIEELNKTKSLILNSSNGSSYNSLDKDKKLKCKVLISIPEDVDMKVSDSSAKCNYNDTEFNITISAYQVNVPIK